MPHEIVWVKKGLRNSAWAAENITARHSREGGNPVAACSAHILDSRLRGNDGRFGDVHVFDGKWAVGAINMGFDSYHFYSNSSQQAREYTPIVIPAKAGIQCLLTLPTF
jgi:hypothetical protein